MMEKSEIPLNGNILLVEDDEDLRETIALLLRDQGYEVREANSLKDALMLIDDEDYDCHLVLSDIRMETMRSGIDLVRNLSARRPNLPVILMTAYDSTPVAVAAMREGAVDFLSKPFEDESLLNKVSTNIHPAAKAPDGFITENEAMKGAKRQAKKLAVSPLNILLKGESGTGKEVMARYIHRCSPRADERFVAVNCAAIAENLLEAILFGSVKGGFTDAKDREGKFEYAQGGTIFLDEIGEMSTSLQAKLLRVVENKQVERVGENKLIDLNVRIICATNIDFEKALAEKTFRADLYERLNQYPITLPPLRERPEDVAYLTQHFLAINLPETGLPPSTSFTEEAMNKLKAHSWPRNIRELENVIKRSLWITDSPQIDTDSILLDDI